MVNLWNWGLQFLYKSNNCCKSCGNFVCFFFYFHLFVFHSNRCMPNIFEVKRWNSKDECVEYFRHRWIVNNFDSNIVFHTNIQSAYVWQTFSPKITLKSFGSCSNRIVHSWKKRANGWNFEKLKSNVFISKPEWQYRFDIWRHRKHQ